MIYLCGAGCGDWELMTLRAMRMLKRADCILYDRLLDPEILQFAPKHCECIYVGKQAANHAMTQEQIQELLKCRIAKYMIPSRIIFLDEIARYHLGNYIQSRKDGNPALFVWDKAPYKRLHKTGIRAALKTIARRMGMQCRVYPHKLRKTLGMNLKNSGVDLGCIQEILGHGNPGVTARYYAESTPDTLRSVRKRVAA